MLTVIVELSTAELVEICPSSASQLETISSIAFATSSAFAESYSSVASKSYGSGPPSYQGANVIVPWALQAVPVHVAEQPVATAEQDVLQLSPAQKVLHALAVRVPQELDDEELEEKVVVASGVDEG